MNEDWINEERSPAELLAHPRNPRTHSAAQVDQVVASIREYGFTNPVLVTTDGMIIAGHARTSAARVLGLETIPVRRRHKDRPLTEAQELALVIADNKLAENAGWDDKALGAIMADLRATDFDVAITGFTMPEVTRLLDGLRETEEETEAPPPRREAPHIKRGDVFLLGQHRVMCGDSTSTDDVATLLNGAKPHLMVTDPPYGVEYDPNWRNEADRANGKAYGARAIGTVTNDDVADWTPAWRLFPGDAVYCWHADRRASEVQRSLEAAGFEMRSQIIWAKPRFVISRGDYHWQHEPCWYAVRKGATAHWNGARDQTTLWEIAHQKSETGHGTQKPIEAMLRPIENNSVVGDLVYDPFLGSGTTLIAAEQSGRRCLGMEIDPGYVDVIIRRWQDAVGGAAVREGDEASYDELAGVVA